MSPFLPIAQISPGVGVLNGIIILLFLIACFVLLLVSAVACGAQTWRLSRSGNPKKGRLLAATLVSFLLWLGLTCGCLWVVTPKPLPQFEKNWDFTQSHSLDVIGEHSQQDSFTYTGKIAVQILLPDHRFLSVEAQNLVVKCEQGQVKEIEVLIPGLKSTENVRRLGETILHNLNFAPTLIEHWRTAYPGFGWTEIKSSSIEPKIDMEGDYDEKTAESVVIIWIAWEN